MSKSKSLPNMPLWADDWIGGTMMMSTAEEGLYLRLILAQWKNGPLPMDERKLRRIARLDQDEWDEQWPEVKSKFEEVNGRLINPKCADVTSRQGEYIEQKRRAGKKSAEARSKSAKTPVNPTVVPTPVERTLQHPLNDRCNDRSNGRGNETPNEKATTHTHTHTHTKKDISPENDGAKPSLPRKKYSDGFEVFWKAYKRPDKGSKKSASNQWKSKRLEGRESELIAKADQYAKSVDDPKYMKHAERFLSNELYENEYTPSGKGQSEIESRMFKPMKPRDQTASVQSAYEVGPDGEEL